jgi:hypothetical protein
MHELVVVEVVATESEAALLSSLLGSAGVESTYRLSNYGAPEHLPQRPQVRVIQA